MESKYNSLECGLKYWVWKKWGLHMWYDTRHPVPIAMAFGQPSSDTLVYHLLLPSLPEISPSKAVRALFFYTYMIYGQLNIGLA